MDFTWYPFDKTVCEFKLLGESSIENMIYKWTEDHKEQKHNFELSGWTISEPERTSYTVFGSSNICMYFKVNNCKVPKNVNFQLNILYLNKVWYLQEFPHLK